MLENEYRDYLGEMLELCQLTQEIGYNEVPEVAYVFNNLSVPKVEEIRKTLQL